MLAELTGFLNAAEAVSRDYEHLIAAIGAIATVLAVVISLFVTWHAMRTQTTRVTASASVSGIYHETIDPVPHYITVDILNVGDVDVHVPFSFCRLEFPFSRPVLIFNPMDYSAADEHVSQQVYPVTVSARKSHVFWLSTWDRFRVNMAQSLEPKNAWDKWRFKRAKLYVVTEDRRRFRVKLSKQVMADIVRAAEMTAAQRLQLIAQDGRIEG